MQAQTPEMNDGPTPERVIIGVGQDMTERILTFNTPPNVELMQPIVARLLSRDFSFTEISEARPVMVDEQASATESFMSVRTSHSSDWVAPPIVDGYELTNGSLENKNALAVEAVKFATISLRAGVEAKD